MKNRSLIAYKYTILLLGLAYAVGFYMKWDYMEAYAKATCILVFALFYFKHSKRKHILFGGALALFSITEVLKIYFKFNYIKFSVYTNITAILGYTMLIAYIFSHLEVYKLIKKFWLHTLFLSVISIYIIYNLNSIIFNGHQISKFSIHYISETVYNVCILTLMSLSFLNFLYHDNKRSFLLFIISVFFCLAEIIQVPFLFLADQSALRFAYTLFYVAGYYFVYLYITTRYNKQFKVLH